MYVPRVEGHERARAQTSSFICIHRFIGGAWPLSNEDCCAVVHSLCEYVLMGSLMKKIAHTHACRPSVSPHSCVICTYIYFTYEHEVCVWRDTVLDTSILDTSIRCVGLSVVTRGTRVSQSTFCASRDHAWRNA